MNGTKQQNAKYRTIFSLRIKEEFVKRGINPILEKDNLKNPWYKCWVFEETPAFLEAFKEVACKKEVE